MCSAWDPTLPIRTPTHAVIAYNDSKQLYHRRNALPQHRRPSLFFPDVRHHFPRRTFLRSAPLRRPLAPQLSFLKASWARWSLMRALVY